jgi:hypothetical protein
MPLDRGILEQQLDALGEGTRWWDRRELRDLPAALHADERILAIALGKMNRPRWLRRPWLIVVTQNRLLCLQSGRRMSRRQLEVQGHQIARVSIRIGPFNGRVLVSIAGERYRMVVDRPDAYKIQAAISGIMPTREVTPPSTSPTAMIGRVIQHVLELPAVALQPNEKPATPALPPPRDDAAELRLQLLDEQVQRLQQQVDFLEELLEQRHLLRQTPDDR